MENKTKILVKFENVENEIKTVKLEVNATGFKNIVEETYQNMEIYPMLKNGYYIKGIEILTL